MVCSIEGFHKFVLSKIIRADIEHFDLFYKACTHLRKSAASYLSNKNVDIDLTFYRDKVFGYFVPNSWPVTDINGYLLSEYMISTGISYMKIRPYKGSFHVRKFFNDRIKSQDPVKAWRSLEEELKFINKRILKERSYEWINYPKLKQILFKRKRIIDKITQKIRHFTIINNKIIDSKFKTIQEYRNLCSFKFSNKDISKIKGYDLLCQYGEYHPYNNVLGVVKDHRLSIYDGYIRKIDPQWLMHPANCEFMHMRMNSSKSRNSSITIEELLSSIKEWEK